MEHLMRSLTVFWRSERLLAEYQLKQSSQKIQLNALAGLVGLFGLVMLSLAVFFALVPYWGHALAALVVSGTDLLLAMVLILFARSRKPTAEVNMVSEVRDMALSDIEEEFTLMQEEVVALKEGIHRFMQHPVDTLLPGAIGPLLGAVVRSLGAVKK
ncbi:MAG: phage holin family protein [Desulfosarcina sp.]|jgi:hypothetical protein